MVSYQNSTTDFPGVKVTTGETDAAKTGLQLSERQFRLCLICIVATKAVYVENGMIMMNLNDAADALRCLGVSGFEARPMLQMTLNKLGEHEDLRRVSL